MTWNHKNDITPRPCSFKGCKKEMGYDGYELHRYYDAGIGKYLYLCPEHAELIQSVING